VVCPAEEDTTTDSSVSPAGWGLVTVIVAVAVRPAPIDNDDGLMGEAGSYRHVLASHCTVPLVPFPPLSHRSAR